MREAVLVDLLDEVAEHLFGDVEVGDDAVRVHLAASRVDRDDGGFGQDDATAAYVDERVRGTEVHGHVSAAEARERVEEGHDRASSLAASGSRVAACPLTRSAWRWQPLCCTRCGT